MRNPRAAEAKEAESVNTIQHLRQRVIRAGRERPKRILIGVGSAVGAAALTLGATYAAGTL